MNLRRGLLRLWLALSLCWVAVIGVYVWNQEQARAKRLEAHISCVKEEGEKGGGRDLEREIYPMCVDRSGATLEDLAFAFWRVTVTDTIKSYFKEYGGLMLLPPLVTLGLGLLAAWVLSGFARKGVAK
jgi:hypothetical protein